MCCSTVIFISGSVEHNQHKERITYEIKSWNQSSFFICTQTGRASAVNFNRVARNILQPEILNSYLFPVGIQNSIQSLKLRITFEPESERGKEKEKRKLDIDHLK